MNRLAQLNLAKVNNADIRERFHLNIINTNLHNALSQQHNA